MFLTNYSFNLGTARAYGVLKHKFQSVGKRYAPPGAFSLYWDSNAFALPFSELWFCLTFRITEINSKQCSAVQRIF